MQCPPPVRREKSYQLTHNEGRKKKSRKTQTTKRRKTGETNKSQKKYASANRQPTIIRTLKWTTTTEQGSHRREK